MAVGVHDLQAVVPRVGDSVHADLGGGETITMSMKLSDVLTILTTFLLLGRTYCLATIIRTILSPIHSVVINLSDIMTTAETGQKIRVTRQ